ncbi:MAG: hypothetical protein AB8D52_10145 [Gammaproteobacteria bacterium]
MRIIGIVLIIVLISGVFWLLNKEDNIKLTIPSSDQSSPSSNSENDLQKKNTEIQATVKIDESTIQKEASSSPFKGPSIEVDESLYGNGPSTGADTSMELTAPEDSLPN